MLSASKRPLLFLAAAILVFFLMLKRTANATLIPTAGNFRTRSRILQLSDAISTIEGGTATNPGNIRAGDGSIAQSADLVGMLNRDFVLQSSSLYDPSMTFREFAWMYVSGATVGDWSKVASTDNPDNWAAFVAGRLGVSVDSTVGDFINS